MNVSIFFLPERGISYTIYHFAIDTSLISVNFPISAALYLKGLGGLLGLAKTPVCAGTFFVSAIAS